MPVRLPVQLHRTAGANVRVRVRKGQVIEVTGATCTVYVAGGPVGGCVPVLGYSPNVGDQVIVNRTSVVTYVQGAFTPP